eukprot:gene27632-7269_t
MFQLSFAQINSSDSSMRAASLLIFVLLLIKPICPALGSSPTQHDRISSLHLNPSYSRDSSDRTRRWRRYLRSYQGADSANDSWLSAYRSLGLIEGFTGDVSPGSAAWKQALGKCSFNKEVILLSSTEDSIDAAAQTVWMLGRFNISHIILITPSATACKLSMDGIPELQCCVHMQLDLPQNVVARAAFGNHRKLMHIRLRLATRAIRLQYNVMFLDTDLIIFDNPYKYLKATTPTKCTGLPLQPNIGVMYVQNAAPDGPVTWIFADTIDRALRWSEDPDFLVSKTDPKVKKDVGISHALWDQSILSDSMLSAAIGRPLFANSFLIQEEGRNLPWFHLHSDLGKKKIVVSEHVPESGTKDVIRMDSFPLQWIPLVVPSSGGEWPEKFGGRGLPAERGALSMAWMELLRNESGAPMWKDPDVVKRADGADGGMTHQEMRSEWVASLPSWFVTSWWTRDKAMRGDWDFHTKPPPQVIGHMLWMPHDKKVYKNALKMAYGWYNFSIGNASQHGQLYQASTHASALRAFMIAAVISNRAVAWPALPCSQLQKLVAEFNNNKHGALLRSKDRQYISGTVPFTAAAAGKDKELCMWYDYMNSRCLEDGVGLMPPEFEHLVLTLKEEAVPSSLNMLRSEHWFPATGGSGTRKTATSPATREVHADVSGALAELSDNAEPALQRRLKVSEPSLGGPRSHLRMRRREGWGSGKGSAQLIQNSTSRSQYRAAMLKKLNDKSGIELLNDWFGHIINPGDRTSADGGGNGADPSTIDQIALVQMVVVMVQTPPR